MKIKLCKNKSTQVRKGKYIDRDIANQLVEIARGVRGFNEGKYAKAIQYLEKKATNSKATERIKYIIGASYVEIEIREKEAAELLKSIIQNHKDEPKEKRPLVYAGAILEYAKIQLRNELSEFAIYLLEDITTEKNKYSVEALTELAKAYEVQAQALRVKEKSEEALEEEKKAEQACIKCKELSKENPKTEMQAIKARKVLATIYIKQGKIELAEKEFEEIKEINPKDCQEGTSSLQLLKTTYFKEETEEEVNKRIKRLEKKMEAIENGEEEAIKEYARELNVISRVEFYEELSPDLKVYAGTDIFTGYKMFEYSSKSIIVIDKAFSEIKDGKKIVGSTYVFPSEINFELEKLSRNEVINMLSNNSSFQKQEHKGDYYNSMHEKMKRAELEGLVIEEKKLKAKEKELEIITKENTDTEKNEERSITQKEDSEE